MYLTKLKLSFYGMFLINLLSEQKETVNKTTHLKYPLFFDFLNSSKLNVFSLFEKFAGNYQTFGPKIMTLWDTSRRVWHKKRYFTLPTIGDPVYVSIPTVLPFRVYIDRKHILG